MKFTKIVCTIGPASEKTVMLEKLIKAGMNVARLNFSHGSYASHTKLIKNIRAAAKKKGEPVAILQDLQGPRIRIGEVADVGVEIRKGESVAIVPQEMYDPKSKTKMLPNHCPQLAKDVRAGSRILIADGVMELRILRVRGPEIHCSVVVGGIVKSHKGMNFPGATLTISSITDKDKKDVAFGALHGVEYVALSFVRNADDVRQLRKIIQRHQGKNAARQIGIIAKIERMEAIHNFDEILASVDGIMIARGDLGIEIPAERVPILQKELIHKCIHARKPVIVATQMMESMIENRRPTRAEVSDVANAVIDHTDAVMLSGESASGHYPKETVEIMAKTIHEAEKSKFDDYRCPHVTREKSNTEMIAHAVCDMALSGQIKLIVMESNGEMARLTASHRPEVRIIGFSDHAFARAQNNLIRGVTLFPKQKNIFSFLKKMKLAKAGDLIVEVEENEIELTRVK